MNKALRARESRCDAAPVWRRSLCIRTLNACAIVVALLLGLAALVTFGRISVAASESEQVGSACVECLGSLRLIVGLLLAVVLLVIVANALLVVRPLASYARRVKDGEPLVPAGASELRSLADAYNATYRANRARTLHLRRAAERDALTGMYNRGVYDMLLAEHSHDVALLLIDVDRFKAINDGHGHDVGDAVLKKVATAIARSFRSTDYPCRVGGDEFAVIMTGVGSQLKGVVAKKAERMAEALRDTSDGLPEVGLSIGIAFGEDHQDGEGLYRAADRALYQAKQRGGNGFAFAGEGGVAGSGEQSAC